MTIGLDLSINSTGLCINNTNDDAIYYIITPTLTKKQKSIQHDRINYVVYDKKQGNVSYNIKSIANEIRKIIESYDDIECVVIEDIAMAAKGRSIIDLTLLNGYVRCVLDEMNIPYQTISPTQWKKELLGNGQANKDLIVYHWMRFDIPVYNELGLNGIKCDDIADAYFLSCYLNPS